MQLNQGTDYAFRAVLHLANLPFGQVVTAQNIATAEMIPMRFLLKIMRHLTKAGLVKSFRGVEGGYALAKAPQEITLLDVVEAIEGPVTINRCQVDKKYCSKNWADRCPVHKVLGGIKASMVEQLASHNFADLVRKSY